MNIDVAGAHGNPTKHMLEKVYYLQPYIDLVLHLLCLMQSQPLR